MSVLVCIVHISKIIEVIFILIDQRLQHLMWNFILLVFRWWLETSWAVWIDLGQRLIFLCIVSDMIQVFIGIVMV